MNWRRFNTKRLMAQLLALLMLVSPLGHLQPLAGISVFAAEPEQEVLSPADSSTNRIENKPDELIHRSYYITKRHVKALKIRAAVSDKPEEKDLSAIVRAALDFYLAEDLKNI